MVRWENEDIQSSCLTPNLMCWLTISQNIFIMCLLCQLTCLFHNSSSATALDSRWNHIWTGTYLHCQTQFQSFRTGWGLSSVICPSSSSMRASVSGGAHSWSRSVAARIRFPADTKARLHTSRPTVTTAVYQAKCTLWLLHNAHC